jgi:elongation factor 1-gamma
MVNGTLYAAPKSFRTNKILIAAKYGDSQIKVECPSQGLDTSKFPFGKLPTFETSDGKALHDTHAIALLVGKSVSGSNPQQSAEILQWLDLADNEFLPQILSWVLPSLSALQYNKNQVEEAKKELIRLLNILNSYLLTRTYLVGERISLADIALSCNLLLAYQHVLEPEHRTPLVNVNRWFQTCVHQPNFLSVLGEVSLCTKSAQFDAQRFKEFQESCGGSHESHEAAKHHKDDKGKKDKKHDEKHDKKKDKEAKKEKHVENGPPATEKPKAAAAPAADDADDLDAADEAMALEPKQKDPFAAMPKGKFVMDDFKKVYSNEDTLTKALPYFWENFDPEANSIWYCEYKYPQELTLVFMSCNLIAGMYQRLDKLRKNAFGSMCLFGSDNNSTISGIWIWRGQDLVFPLSPDWTIDYDSYNWRKLDPKSEETKKMVKEYFAWEGDFDGKKFNQGKIFK